MYRETEVAWCSVQWGSGHLSKLWSDSRSGLRVSQPFDCIVWSSINRPLFESRVHSEGGCAEQVACAARCTGVLLEISL